MLSVCVLTTVLGLAAVPDLTEAQRVQLATAEDGYLPDEPAWTGLLVNVASWELAEVDEVIVPGGFVPGAGVPDYGKLLAEPGEQRGDLFVVEGRFAGRQREMRTQRPGPWGGYLIEWGVVVSAEAAGTADEVVALVYLVDPEGRIEAPREGQAVRGLTRFYKLWTDTDAEGVERTYPVFVGRSMGAVGGASGGGAATTGGAGGVIFIGVVAMAGLLLVVLIAKARVGSRETRRERALDRLRQHATEDAEQDGNDALDEQDLPDDPAEALEQLERRRD